MEFFETAKRGFNILIPRREPVSPLEILNQQLQYIRKYKETIGKEDVLTIINTPHYELLAPYFGLKLFDKNSQAQKELLQIIVNVLKDTQDYGAVKEEVGKFLNNGYEINEVSPNKLSRIALWGPSFVQKRAEEVMQEVKEKHETPVLVAYSGLVGLKPFVRSMNIVDRGYMIFPNVAESSKVGYAFYRDSEKIGVREANREELLNESKVALIDDTIHTGKTLQGISSLFPRASIHEATLFKT